MRPHHTVGAFDASGAVAIAATAHMGRWKHPLELLKTTIYARCIGLKPKEKAINLKSNLIHKISNNFQFHRIKYNFTLAVSVCVRVSVWQLCVYYMSCFNYHLVYYSFSDLLSVVHRTTYMVFSMLCHLRQRFVWLVLSIFSLFFRFVSFQLNFMKYKPRRADRADTPSPSRLSAAKRIYERKREM